MRRGAPRLARRTARCTAAPALPEPRRTAIRPGSRCAPAHRAGSRVHDQSRCPRASPLPCPPWLSPSPACRGPRRQVLNPTAAWLGTRARKTASRDALAVGRKHSQTRPGAWPRSDGTAAPNLGGKACQRTPVLSSVAPALTLRRTALTNANSSSYFLPLITETPAALTASGGQGGTASGAGPAG